MCAKAIIKQKMYQEIASTQFVIQQFSGCSLRDDFDFALRD